MVRALESPGSSFAYTYGPAGNRTAVKVNGVQTASYAYNAANEVQGWTYDAAGNLTSDGVTSYSFDALSRLSGTTATGQTRAYAYNGDGSLVSATANGTTTSYAQDLAGGQSQVLGTTSGGITSDYLYGADRLASLTSGTRTWYGTDNQGSVRQTLSDTGGVLGTQNYDPYGTPEGGVQPTFGYTGELQDGTTSAVYLRARWYQPGTGTLLGVDPRLSQTGQAYGYAGDNPVNGSDPSGTCYAVLGTAFDYWSGIDGSQPCGTADLYGIQAFHFAPTLTVQLTSAQVSLLTGPSGAAGDREAQGLISQATSCAATAGIGQGSTLKGGSGLAPVITGAGVLTLVGAIGLEGETTAEGCVLGGIIGCGAAALIGGVIIVGLVAGALSRSVPLADTTTAQPTPEKPVNRGSIQIQGRDINAPGGTLSWNWARSGSVPASEGSAELTILWNMLSRTQQRIRDQAYIRAQNRIRTAPPTGLPQGTHLPYQNGPGNRGKDNTARIDLVVNTGVAFDIP